MNNKNSVCYVATIEKISNIPGADNVVLAELGGWSCIVKKDEYVVGSNVIIATTDAVIPVEISDPINVTGYLRKGQRVRTIKLKGVYSECLIIPINFLQEKLGIKGLDDIEVGKDMSKILNIHKFEETIDNTSNTSNTSKKTNYKTNKNFKVYYKFPNLKNVKGMFSENDDVEITRKIHGTNARYGIIRKENSSLIFKIKKLLKLTSIMDEYTFVIGSHNVEKTNNNKNYYNSNVWKDVSNLYNIEEKLWDMFKNNKYIQDNIKSGIIIYGEIYGPGIQKNYDYKLNKLKFSVFDVTLDGKYLPVDYSKTIADRLELDYVDILYKGKWSQETQDKFVFDNFIEGTKIPHEGIVIKLTNGAREQVAKVINPDYLIYSEKNNVGDSH
jgi:RNA ligase (TIGR02306 family)